MMNVFSFLWTSAGQKADGITPTHTHTHTWRTSTMSSRPLSSVSVGTRGVPGNYTTGWITCRSNDCRRMTVAMTVGVLTVGSMGWPHRFTLDQIQFSNLHYSWQKRQIIKLELILISCHYLLSFKSCETTSLHVLVFDITLIYNWIGFIF